MTYDRKKHLSGIQRRFRFAPKRLVAQIADAVERNGPTSPFETREEYRAWFKKSKGFGRDVKKVKSAVLWFFLTPLIEWLISRIIEAIIDKWLEK